MGRVPPYEKLDADLLGHIDEVLPLHNLTLSLRVGRKYFGIPKVRDL